MGNAIFFCMLHPVSTVRVIRSDGEVAELDHPVIAKQLMKAYPGHLVVHCAEVSRNSGVEQRSKVSMLRAEDLLTPGQTYCLLRVPTQAGNSLLPKASGEKGKISKSSPMTPVRGMLFGALDDVGLSDSEVAQREQFLIQYTINAPPAAQLLQQQQHSGPWRPQLDAIIESPLNSNVPSRNNSITMSPLARQAGYRPTSPLKSGRRPLTTPAH